MFYPTESGLFKTVHGEFTTTAAYTPGILFSPESKQAALPFPRRKKKSKAKNLLERIGGGREGGRIGEDRGAGKEKRMTPVAKLSCGPWRKSAERKDWNEARVAGALWAPITT